MKLFGRAVITGLGATIGVGLGVGLSLYLGSRGAERMMKKFATDAEEWLAQKTRDLYGTGE